MSLFFKNKLILEKWSWFKWMLNLMFGASFDSGGQIDWLFPTLSEVWIWSRKLGLSVNWQFSGSGLHQVSVSSSAEKHWKQILYIQRWLTQLDLVNINQCVNAFTNESFQTSSINGVWEHRRRESLTNPSQGLALIEQSLTDQSKVSHLTSLVKYHQTKIILVKVRFDEDRGTFADTERGTFIFSPTFDQ